MACLLTQNVIEFYEGLVICGNLILLACSPFAALSGFNSLMSESQLVQTLRSHVESREGLTSTTGGRRLASILPTQSHVDAYPSEPSFGYEQPQNDEKLLSKWIC